MDKILRKIWIKEWFGINLSDYFEVHDDRIADNVFLNKYYHIIFERFSDFDDLPYKWRQEKTEIAKDIYALLKSLNSNNVLSIGSGIGYIEKCIYELSSEINITAIDPSVEINCFNFPDKIDLRNGFFPNIVRGEKFDFAYASIIDYCFNDQQYYKFLKDTFNFRFPVFMLASLVDGKQSPLTFIKDMLRQVLFKMNIYQRGQFWGYLRSMNEHIKMVKLAGYTIIETGKHSKSNMKWIIARR